MNTCTGGSHASLCDFSSSSPGHGCRQADRAHDRYCHDACYELASCRPKSSNMMPCRLHARLPCPSAPAPLLSQSGRFSTARHQPASVGQPRQQRGFRCRGAAEPDSEDGVLRRLLASAMPPALPYPASRQCNAKDLSHCTCAGGNTSIPEPDVVIRPPALDKEVRLAVAHRATTTQAVLQPGPWA